MAELKEFIAGDRSGAINLAEQHFGVGPDELEVVDVSGEVYGLGGRVMILAGLPGSGPPRDSGGRGGRSDRGERSQRPERGRRRERNERGGRSERGRGRRDSEPRGPRDSRAAASGSREGGRGPSGAGAGDSTAIAAPGPAAPGTEGLGEVGLFVAGLLERMGAGEGLQVQEQRSDRELRLSASGAGVDALLERDPRIIDPLTHLADRAAVRYLDRGIRVRIELAGTEAGLDETDLLPDEQGLLEEARRLAQEVLESGEPRETIELSSRERWLVHNGLREIDGVKSESTGEGAEKRVRIIPAGSSR